MTTPSFHSDPYVQFLTQILEDIRSGYIQVPRFQRPLVWRWETRLELLRSIRDGIPMGAIMVWRSPQTKIDCYSLLGPHKLSKPGALSSVTYLLDGVQRLSTLYGALHQADPPVLLPGQTSRVEYDDEDPPSEDFEVFYDLVANDFFAESEIELGNPKMPLHLIFDSVEMLRFQRRLSESITDDRMLEIAVSNSEAVTKAFREYKVPIIPIVTDSVELATRTFQRINSQGKPMSEAHMIHALSWGEDFDLNRRLMQLRDEYLSPLNWGHLDSDVILKACKAALGFDVYRSDADHIGAAFRDRSDVIAEVGEGCRGAAKFLREWCGVPRPELIPYSLQAASLIDFFRRYSDPDPSVLEGLADWFWVTTYGEIFAGMSGDRFDQMLTMLRKFGEGNKLHWIGNKPFEYRKYPSKFDFRSARAKAFSFRLAERRNIGMKNESGTALLEEYGRECLVQVLPRISPVRKIYSSYANRFLLPPSDAIAFRDRLLSGFISRDEATSHMIDGVSLNLLRSGDHEGFIDRRLDAALDFESKFLSNRAARFGVSL